MTSNKTKKKINRNNLFWREGSEAQCADFVSDELRTQGKEKDLISIVQKKITKFCVDTGLRKVKGGEEKEAELVSRK